MKTITTVLAILTLATIAAPAEANAIEDSVAGCWVHMHTMEVRSPKQEVAHITGETVSCGAALAVCLFLHPETREYRTPEQHAAHYAHHVNECGSDALGA